MTINTDNFISKIDKRYYVNIPYQLKDKLKEAVKSAKWDIEKRKWYVGVRSVEKVKSLISENSEHFSKLNTKIEKVKNNFLNSICLTENTYSVKDIIINNFDAVFCDIFGIKGWYMNKTDENIKKIEEYLPASCFDGLIVPDIFDIFKFKLKENGICYTTSISRNPTIFNIITKKKIKGEYIAVFKNDSDIKELREVIETHIYRKDDYLCFSSKEIISDYAIKTILKNIESAK